MNSMNDTRPITLLICALGGEGGGVLTEWLIDIARHAGYAAQSTSIPGVAQRTGATTYYLEVFPVPIAQLDGRQPVFSLSPVPGALDAIVSSELLETARQIGNGMSTAQRTLVITSSSRTLTTAERMQPGDGRADAQRLLDTVKCFSREHHVFDMGATAREAGTIVSAVMLGAIAGSGLLPFRATPSRKWCAAATPARPKSSTAWRRPTCAASQAPSMPSTRRESARRWSPACCRRRRTSASCAPPCRPSCRPLFPLPCTTFSRSAMRASWTTRTPRTPLSMSSA